MTKLCDVAFKYGTDKCPQIYHTYTPYYYDLFKDKRESVKKVVEIGIGHSQHLRHAVAHYVTGASLRMWRDFFPNAQVYGADIIPETMFIDNRITTYICDETKKEDLEKLIKKIGSDIDIFIDDGWHARDSQVFVCKTVMPLLKKNVVYIIEDLVRPYTAARTLEEYDCFVPKLPNPKGIPRNKIVIVKNKQ